jgi:allantoin racemase
VRIWHQSMTVLGDLPAYAASLRAHISEVVRPDTEVDLHGFVPGTFKANYPGPDIATSYLYWLHGNQWIAAGLEAERQGYDAMVLASLPGPMLREIRTLIDIPVVGYGDTAFRMAGLYGRRFGLVFFNTEREEFWPDYIRAMGLADLFAGIRPAGVSFQEVAAALGDPAQRDGVVGRARETIERMVRDLKVDVIVPGEMPLNLLLANAGVGAIGGATVIDGLAMTFKTAEMMVELKRQSGMMQSRRGWFHGAPERARVQEALEFYGLDTLGARIPGDR